MTPFRIAGTFEAADIDDAILYLARHFAAVADGTLSELASDHSFEIGPAPEHAPHSLTEQAVVQPMVEISRWADRFKAGEIDGLGFTLRVGRLLEGLAERAYGVTFTDQPGGLTSHDVAGQDRPL